MKPAESPTLLDWQTDYDQRVNPKRMTGLLQQAIPALRWADWRVTRTTLGTCESILPLSKATTNQHGTHQAALMSLAADYTGGLALTTVLHGVPIAGVHPGRTDETASLWLAAMNVRYQYPSTGHLTLRSEVSPELIEKVWTRFFDHKRTLVQLPVILESNDQVVAHANMTYFVQSTSSLMDTSEGKKRTGLFQHKLKTSARMIAGIRARKDLLPQGGEPSWEPRVATKSVHQAATTRLRIDDSHDEHAAGAHGVLLAQRMSRVLPQLETMVTARTRHGDELLLSEPEVPQIILLGAGLDMRPIRLARSMPRATFFEVDLPEMLEERKRVLAKLSFKNQDRRVDVQADFLTEDIGQQLLATDRFDPKLKTFVIYEGCSMYFPEPSNERILRSVANVVRNPNSRLWCDFVSRSVIVRSTGDPNVNAFLDQMIELGESFIFGPESPSEFLQRCGWANPIAVTTQQYLDSKDSTLGVYWFTVSNAPNRLSTELPVAPISEQSLPYRT